MELSEASTLGERYAELVHKVAQLETSQKMLLKFLSRDLWDEIDDEVYNTNTAKHLLDMIENVLDAFGDKAEE